MTFFAGFSYRKASIVREYPQLYQLCLEFTTPSSHTISGRLGLKFHYTQLSQITRAHKTSLKKDFSCAAARETVPMHTRIAQVLQLVKNSPCKASVSEERRKSMRNRVGCCVLTKPTKSYRDRMKGPVVAGRGTESGSVNMAAAWWPTAELPHL